MVEGRLLGHPVGGVSCRVPGVEVSIEVQNRDGFLVDFVQRAQSRESYAVVPAQCEQLRLARGDALGSVLGA